MRVRLVLLCLVLVIVSLGPRARAAADVGYFISGPFEVHYWLSDDDVQATFRARASTSALELVALSDAPDLPELARARQRQRALDLAGAAAAYRDALDRELPGAWRGPARHNLVLLEDGLGLRRARSFSPLRDASRAERRGAAAALWTLSAGLEDASRARFDREYLEAFADVLDPATRAAAELEIAWSRWRLSCPLRAPLEGLCAARIPVRWRACHGPRDLEVLELAGRDPALAREAQELAALALRRARAAARRDPNSYVLQDIIARARLLRAEPEFEAFLRLRSPKSSGQVAEWKRDLGVPRWELEYAVEKREARRGEARARRFLRRVLDDYHGLERRYIDIARAGGPEAVTAALLRGAQLLEHLTQELEYQGGEARDEPEEKPRWSCCRSVTDGWHAEVVARLQQCSELAARHHYRDPWVRACEAKLSRWGLRSEGVPRELYMGGPPAPAVAAGPQLSLPADRRTF
ncbi:MAG: hypothetical protein H6713_16045 [Myxococcales bacterium]|nr:hypothetical protein [Myxococcales bacterium]